MGRQQDLERLALGRSAFQGPIANDAALTHYPQDNAVPQVNNQLDETIYKQQYDDKGRPINPSTEATNQAMRHAQNAVIALTGAVESREASSRDEHKQRQINRIKTLESEDERGDDLTLLSAFLRVLLTRWPESLIARMQAGAYNDSSTFADIVLRDLIEARNGGFLQCLNIFLGGLPLSICYHFLKSLLVKAVRHPIGRLQSLIDRRLPSKHSRRASNALLFFFEGLVVAIEVALLPLPYYVTAQKLNLAPSWPPLPDKSILLPWSSSSLHSLIWKPFANISRFSILFSPAAMLLLQNILRDRRDAEGTHMDQLIAYDEPPINESAADAHRETNRGLFGGIMSVGYGLRKNVLKWMGWTVEYIVPEPQPSGVHQNSHVPEPPVSDQSGWSQYSDIGVICRSTSLSQLSVQYLADRVDDMYLRLLKLPWQSCLLRAISQTFLDSTLTRTPFAMTMTPHVFSPLRGGLLGVVRGNIVWSDAISYASTLSLGVALHCSVDLGIFFVMYWVTRWQGVRNFHWGQASTIKASRRRDLGHRRSRDSILQGHRE